MSNVYLNFFCLNFRWGEKLDIKIWFYCFQFPRVQILLFVGWNSTRVCECHLSVSAIPQTALHVQRRQISGREDVFRNRRAPSPTSWRFPFPNLKISCTRRLWSDRTARGPLFTPVHSPAYKSKFLFVFVCFVSLLFFWSRKLNFRQNNAKIQMKRKENKTNSRKESQ